jgi:hypothetical protein
MVFPSPIEILTRRRYVNEVASRLARFAPGVRNLGEVVNPQHEWALASGEKATLLTAGNSRAPEQAGRSQIRKKVSP